MTEDGYILALHRITSPRHRERGPGLRQVAMMIMMNCSDDDSDYDRSSSSSTASSAAQRCGPLGTGARLLVSAVLKSLFYRSAMVNKGCHKKGEWVFT